MPDSACNTSWSGKESTVRCLLYLVRLSCGIPFNVISFSRFQVIGGATGPLIGPARSCTAKRVVTNVVMVTTVLMAVLHPDDNSDCSHVLRGRCTKPKTVSQYAAGSRSSRACARVWSVSFLDLTCNRKVSFWSPNLVQHADGDLFDQAERRVRALASSIAQPETHL